MADPGSMRDTANVSPARAAMKPTRRDPARLRTVRELYELIAALDRRVAQVERVGEIAIARAAAALRAEALERIHELEGDAPVAAPPVDPA